MHTFSPPTFKEVSAGEQLDLGTYEEGWLKGERGGKLWARRDAHGTSESLVRTCSKGGGRGEEGKRISVISLEKTKRTGLVSNYILQTGEKGVTGKKS